jgi:hypothetical protein
MEENGVFYCCAHCAKQNGIHLFKDRITAERSKA